MKQAWSGLIAVVVVGSASQGMAQEGFVEFARKATGYRVAVSEYRDITSRPSSLRCGEALWSKAPIVISFGGANGQGADALDADFGRRLSRACIRLVAVQGIDPYLPASPAPSTTDPSAATKRVVAAADNVASAVEFVIGKYPLTTHVTYRGGSASAIYGAKVLEQKTKSGALGVAPWSKVRRFIFGALPTADITEACKNTADGDTVFKIWGLGPHTGYSTCKQYLGSRLSGSGYSANPIYSAFTSTAPLGSTSDLQKLANWGVKVNGFTGTSDEIFGFGLPGFNCATATSGSCWNGPQGFDGYLNISALRNVGVNNRTLTDTRTAKFTSTTAKVTFTKVRNATHTLSGPQINAGLCDVIAEGQANTIPAGCYDVGPITGIIDGVVNNTINGWACARGSPYSIPVHVYLGGPAGAGTILGGYAAANASESEVAAVCGSFGTAYRFAIPLSLGVRQAYAGRKIYVHGIHPTGPWSNDLLVKSGTYSVPWP